MAVYHVIPNDKAPEGTSHDAGQTPICDSKQLLHIVIKQDNSQLIGLKLNLFLAQSLENS